MARLWTFARACARAWLIGLALTSVAMAQTAPPAGMSQEQFDAMVTAITRAVIAQTGRPAGPPAPAPAAQPGNEILLHLQEAIAEIPTLPGRWAAAINALDGRAAGGHGPLIFLFVVALVCALAYAVEWTITRAWGRLRTRLGTPVDGSPIRLGRLAALALMDVVEFGSLIVIARAAAFALGDTPAQTQFAELVVGSFIAWRLYVALFEIWLRPTLPAARIAPIDDAAALTIRRVIAIVTAIVLVARTWIPYLIAIDTPAPAITAFALINNPIVTLTFVWSVLQLRRPVSAWLEGLITGRARAAKVALAHRWWIGAIGFYALLSFGQAFGVLSGRFGVSAGLNATQNLVIALLLGETAIFYFARRGAAGAKSPRAADVVAHCLRLALRIAIAIAVAQIWVVDVLALMRFEEWRGLGRALATAGAALVVAYVVWQVIKFNIDAYLARHPAPATGIDQDPDAPAPGPATRLRTMLPLARGALAVVLVALATLIALGELGVNITPLIAGASILGLAISFGSQALVRDIVSGVFFLADDAFRVGEYIDTGRAKGTVEGFTLRSIKLRHQNGQVHTIPFGQLASITNFSRDWVTVKFNLRLARDTDIELVRKTVKKIGLDLAADPALKHEILVPLKLQGIADITDTALVLRFKFTARPGNPGIIQRLAARRMYEVFPAKGIGFAQPMVSVHALGSEAIHAAAANAVTQQPAG